VARNKNGQANGGSAAGSAAAAAYRDRIVGQEEVDLALLTPHPHNWRTHSELQASSLDGLLANVGTVQTVVWNRATGHVLDGHLRRELAERRGERRLRVTVVDLTEEEELIVLATFDPMGGMAGVDESVFRDLVAQIELGEQGDWLTGLLEAAASTVGVDLDGVGPEPPDEFTEYGDDIATEHQCPRCGYVWSGGKVVRADGDGASAQDPDQG
jgi:hypothetical protein